MHPETANQTPMRTVFLLLLAAATPALADGPEIVDAEARSGSSGWSFSVTIRHPDSGWDHYADGWEIRGADGSLLGERPLAHPHVSEQPFTRSLSGVAIPDDVTQVFVRARCNHGDWAVEDFVLKLTR